MEFQELSVFLFIFLVILLDKTVLAAPEYFIEDHCGQMLNLNYGGVEVVRLRLTKNDRYPDGMRCRMIIQAPEGKRLMMRIEDLDLDVNTVLHNSQNNPNTQTNAQDCGSGDYLLFMDGPDEKSLPMLGLPGKVCQKPDQKAFLSSGRYIALFFMSNTNMISGKGLKLLFTAFNDGPCKDNQFTCKGTGICLKEALECDGYSHCLDGSDEAMPRCLSTGAIIGIAVAGTIMIILIVVIVVICVTAYQRRKRARIIKRAVDKGNYPYVVWDGNDTSVIFDPITVEHIRKYTAIDAGSPDDETYDVKLKDGILVGPHTVQEVKRRDSESDKSNTEPKDKDEIKYPSGYWDIPLSDLGIKPVTDL